MTAQRTEQEPVATITMNERGFLDIRNVRDLTLTVGEPMPLYARPVLDDKGPWHVDARDAAIYSSDFTHDVRLSVNGDFADHDQKRWYAEGLASKLNSPVLDDEGMRLLREVWNARHVREHLQGVLDAIGAYLEKHT